MVAGTGLLGCVIARLASPQQAVVLTDLPHVLPRLRKAVLLRLYVGAIKALVRLYEGSVGALSRLY